MPYDLDLLHGDVAQIQHDDAGFGSGRLLADDLVLTAAHTLCPQNSDKNPFLDGWQVRLARDRRADKWPFRRSNRVVWHDLGLDLALIKLVDPEGGPVRPRLSLRVATVSRSNPHGVEARGYPRASKQGDGPRELLPVLGRLTAAEQDRPLRFGVDQCDLPNDPHAGWPGMSGSIVLLQEGHRPDEIWVYGAVQAVPGNFNRQLTVARLATAWRDPTFRTLLVAAGAPDQDAEDPSLDDIGAADATLRLLPDLTRNVPAAAEAVIRSKETIANTYRQVDKLELLKMVHDALHTVEFEVLRPMEEEGAATGVRPSFAVRFAGKRRSILEGIQGRDMPRVLQEDLVEQLEATVEAFQQAAKAPNGAAYALVCGELNRLLSTVSPELDTAISTTASDLPLDRLVELMKMVRDKLTPLGAEQDPARQGKLQEFNLGVDDLTRLREKLTRHVHEHEQLQRLDSKLRSMCSGAPVPGSLASEWQRVKRIRSQLTPPYSPPVEDADPILKDLETRIEKAFVGTDEPSAVKLMREYFRSVSFAFREVDSRFKEFTLGLSRLGGSLKVVLDSL